MAVPVIVGLDAVIVAVTAEVPRILTVTRAEHVLGGAAPTADGARPVDGLPSGPLDPEGDRTLELGLRRWVREQTGLELGYVEQLYTFGDRHRDGAGARVLSVAYLALVREGATSGTGEARWRNCYGYFPWEDWRAGRPEAIDRCISPALGQWAQAATDPAVRRARRERAEIVFGLNGAPWDGERVLDRYELLYEAGLVPEAARDPAGRWAARPTAADTPSPTAADTPSPTAADTPSPTDGASRGLLGQAMAADHRRIAATALGRLRGKLKYRPVVFELLPAAFTLLQLQRVVEALAGVRLHKQNFRRLVERGRLVEGTGRLQAQTGGRPAELFRFRREVLHERPAPGVGLPELRSATVMAGAKPRG